MKKNWLKRLAVVLTVGIIQSGVSVSSFAMDDTVGDVPGSETAADENEYMEITGAQISPDEGEVRRKYEQITSDLISHAYNDMLPIW